MPLTSKQVRYLRGLTHQLQPVVRVADKGLNENVMAEIESALQHHELIKIKLRADRDTRKSWIRQISTQSCLRHRPGRLFFPPQPEKAGDCTSRKSRVTGNVYAAWI